MDVPSSLVPREGEIFHVRTLLRRPGRRKAGVVVVGRPGIGKTTFTRLFEESCREDFPGGIIQTSGAITWYYDVAGEISRLPLAERTLLIIDDAHLASPELSTALARLKRERPNVRMLLTVPDNPERIPSIPSLEWNFYFLTSWSVPQLIALAEKAGLRPDLAHELAYESDGNPRTALTLAKRGGSDNRFHHFAQLAEGMPTILGPDGLPLDQDASGLTKVEAGASAFSDAVLEWIAQNPDEMHGLSSRQFEELVAELYDREGYDVKLTPVSGDGGVDIYAVQHTPFGSYLTIIDCKRYRKDRPIKVGLVRQLLGAVEAKNASVGVLATTSYFTKGAKAFQEERPYRLGLQDFFSIHDMLVRNRDSAA